MAETMDSLLDQIMWVMDNAFDPAFGEAWTRQQVADSLALPNVHALVLTANGEPPAPGEKAAGFALSRRVVDEEELLLVAVRKEARRKSLGARLVQKFMENARAAGVHHVFLEMREGNPAEKLYVKHGFSAIGLRKLYYLGSDGIRRDAITFGRVIS